MYERLLLESGKVFDGSRSGVGVNVTDDTQDITVPYVAGEGKAEIVSVTAPESFTPGVSFQIDVVIKNTSTFGDTLFVSFTDIDTGEVLATSSTYVDAGVTAPPVTFITTLTQTTDFHCRIKAGHAE